MKMENLLEAHYFPLPSQGNVYLSTNLEKINGCNKLLVATLRRKFFTLEYTFQNNVLKPITKEVNLAFMPSGSELISLDAFNRSKEVNDFVIGVTLIKKTDHGDEMCLNFYCDYDAEGSDANFESIGHCCESLELNFLPYGLYHAQIPTRRGKNYENIWLLSGNDEKIHAYKGNYADRCHGEICTADFFPEFAHPTSRVFSLNVAYLADDRSKRISCFGCEDGEVRCCIVDAIKCEIFRSFPRRNFGSPVPDVLFFSSAFREGSDEKMELNLLVLNTVAPSAVYMNVLNEDLNHVRYLECSDKSDTPTCCTIGDMDFDGNPEILIGTFEQEILLYKYGDNSWSLQEDRRKMPFPIHALYNVEFTLGGVKDLTVITTRGCHILQHDPDYILKVLKDSWNSSDQVEQEEK